jgi:Family of unknown function (DUF6191)
MTQWGLDVLFNPAKRHMDDEKQRLQSTREEVGDASKGNRIDLSTGKVVIRRKVTDEVADEATDEAANAAADEVSDEAATEADETADHPATSAESELD